MTNIFSEEFIKLDPKKIADEININGYFSFSKAVNIDVVKKIENDLSKRELGINSNFISPVWCNNQYFFTHALASSKTYYDLVTSEKLRSIAKSKFKNYFRLKCHRYYETFPSHHMNWHEDNVDNDGVAHDNDGLVFIIYINDVFDGEFQLIEGTNLKKNLEERKSNYSDKFINEKFNNKIKSFKLKAGSIIIYDAWHIHRAKPITDKKFTRKSIFFQVETAPNYAEKILLNPEFIEKAFDKDTELLSYLGFGVPAKYMPDPITNINMLPFKNNLKFVKNAIKSGLINGIKNLVKIFLSHDQIVRIATKNKLKNKLKK
jgi:hypothetical protein